MNTKRILLVGAVLIVVGVGVSWATKPPVDDSPTDGLRESDIGNNDELASAADLSDVRKQLPFNAYFPSTDNFGVLRASVSVHVDLALLYSVVTPESERPLLVTQKLSGSVSSTFASADDLLAEGWTFREITIAGTGAQLGKSTTGKWTVLLFRISDTEISIMVWDHPTAEEVLRSLAETLN